MFTLAKASVKYVVIGDCILCAHPYALSILYFEKTRQHFYVIELGFRLYISQILDPKDFVHVSVECYSPGPFILPC